MSSLDKLALNNQIVSMRHDVRRAKLHTINKIVKESRKLKDKKGTEEQRNKYMRKYDRLIEEIKAIKELKDDEVSKFFLAKEQDPLSLLNDPNSSIRLKALAKVGMNNILKASLYEFRQKYPNASIEVPMLLPILGERVKKNKKKKSGNLKENNFLTTNVNPTKKNNKDSVNSDDNNKGSCIVNTSGNNGFLVERINKRNNDAIEVMIPKEKEVPRVKKIKNDCNKTEHNKSKELEEKKIRFVKSPKYINKKEKQKNEIKIVDPFFVTADNTEYMTVATSEKQIEALKNIDDNLKTNKFEKFNSFNKYEFNNNNNNKGNFHKKRFNDKSFSKEKINDRKHISMDNKNRYYRRNEINNLEKVEKLHPSWEAKKKLSGAITAQFAGKKIVFD